jgi:hypothetical protein
MRLRTGSTGPELLITAIQEALMPAQSKAQQKAAGAALAAKRGETKVSELQGASREMYDSMSEEELEDLASTDREDLPERKESD